MPHKTELLIWLPFCFPFLPLIKQRLKGLQEILLWNSCFPQVSLAMTQGTWILWEYLAQWAWIFRLQQPSKMFKYVSELWCFLPDTMPVILTLHPSPPPLQPNLLGVFYFFLFLLSISPMCLLNHLTHLRLQLDLPFSTLQQHPTVILIIQIRRI